MTTIAFDGVTMAGDSMHGNVIFGAAGDRQDCTAFEEYITAAGNKPVINPERGFSAISWDGSVLMRYESNLTPWPVQIPYAIGSGTAVAMGAMFAGADAKNAVAIAVELDAWTGGKVTSRTLEG